MKSKAKRPKSSRLLLTAAVPLLLLVPALYIVLSSYSSLILDKQTLAGDNLLPTPWHQFPAEQRRISWSRAQKIFECSFLSCVSTPWSSSSRLASQHRNSSSAERCPDFFQWIHHDLAPWRASGISRAALEEAREFAAFRVAIIGGQLYASLYYQCVQSRAMFTLWSLLLLLERFPGAVPDVEFMFNCMDRPHFLRSRYKSKTPPPLFAYCGSKDTVDIAFPDWSFWGWAEVRIGSWTEELESIFHASEETSWENRRARAQWKGNPHVGAQVRTELLACNTTDKRDSGADIYVQDWIAESRDGFKNSKLSNQCHHRYKVYTEGHAWSVSFKYILACGSTTLIVRPEYHDFFMRGLLPRYHYWPIDRKDMCSSIKHAVEWGNSHPEEAEAIGNNAHEFLRKDLSMDRVYEYMLHLLREYAKLQRFKPSVPEGAQLLCKNAVTCFADAEQLDFLKRSENLKQNHAAPCSMSPADDDYIRKFEQQEAEGFRAVRELRKASVGGPVERLVVDDRSRQAMKKKNIKKTQKRARFGRSQ